MPGTSLNQVGDGGDMEGYNPNNMTEEQKKAKCNQLAAQIKYWQAQVDSYTKKLNGPLSETARDECQKQLSASQATLSSLYQQSNILGCSYQSTPPPPFVYESPMFCGVQMFGVLYEKWKYLKNQMTADGQSIQQYLGSPLAGQVVTGSGVYAQYFERGMLARMMGGSASHVVYGEIYLRYRRLGGLASLLGMPTSDEVEFYGGRKQSFANGSIVWLPSLGAYELYGPITVYWSQHIDFLGWPISGVLKVTDANGVELGDTVRFQNAVVYYSPATGTHEVHGDIREAYESRFGGPTGMLGFPVSDETDTPGGSGRYSDFECGVLVWHSAGSTYAGVYGFTALDLFLMRVQGSGSDGFLNNSQDVYMYVDIGATDGQGFHQRMPPDGDWGASRDIQQVLVGWDVVHGGLKVHVRFDGWDSDSGFLRGWCGDDDDELGIVEEDLTADNLWGTLADFEHWNGQFMVAYTMRGRPQPYDPSLPWRKQCFWAFDNWKTPELTWHQFASTFSDVAEDEDHWLHPFNYLFYSWFYDSLAANGNCHGMCIESIYAQVGRSPFVEPVYQYGPRGTEPLEPADHNLINEINIKHGYQLGDAAVLHFIEKFFTGNTHDPNDVFDESQADFSAGNYPVIVLTPGYFNVGGHVVRPYQWLSDGLGTRTILVANPNAPMSDTGHPTNIDDRCRIQIDENANTFSFFMGQEKGWWNGGDWSGSRMYSMPFSVFSSRQATPFWEVMGLFMAGCLIILGDDAASKQITDDKGRPFYGAFSPYPTMWEHIVQDKSVRFPDMSRIPVLNGDSEHVPELYYFKNCAERGFEHKVIGRGAGTYYNWGLASPLLSVVMRIQSPAHQTMPDTFDAVNLHRTAMQITIKSPVAKTLNIAVQTWTGLVAQINNVKLTANKTLTIALKDCGKAIKIVNTGQPFHSKFAVCQPESQNIFLSRWHGIKRNIINTQPAGKERLIQQGTTIIS
jgi:hypothetical protein